MGEVSSTNIKLLLQSTPHFWAGSFSLHNSMMGKILSSYNTFNRVMMKLSWSIFISLTLHVDVDFTCREWFFCRYNRLYYYSTVMNKTVLLAQQHGVAVGAHPSPARQTRGWTTWDGDGTGRMSFINSPLDQKELLFGWTQVLFHLPSWSLDRFSETSSLPLNHVSFNRSLRLILFPWIKPHGPIYGYSSRSLPFAFIGMAGSAHQPVADEIEVKFILGGLLSIYLLHPSYLIC